MSQTENYAFSISDALALLLIFFDRKTRITSDNITVYKFNDNKEIFNSVNKLMEVNTVSWIISVDQFSFSEDTIGKRFDFLCQKVNFFPLNDLTISEIFSLTEDAFEILKHFLYCFLRILNIDKILLFGNKVRKLSNKFIIH